MNNNFHKTMGDRIFLFSQESIRQAMLPISKGDLSPSIMKAPKPLISCSHHSLTFFKVFFEISHFLCISPFTIRYDTTTCSYYIFKRTFQQGICAILQFSTLFQFLSHFRGIQFDTLRSNPDNYFELANVIGSMFYYITIFSTLWRKQDEFLNIFNSVGDNFQDMGESESDRWTKLRRNIIPLIFCSAYICLAFYCVSSGTVAPNKWNFLNIPFPYSARANYVYLLQDFDEKFGIPTIWYIFVECYIWLNFFFTDLLFIMSTLFLWELANDFCKYLKTTQASSEGISLYFSLRGIVKNLNLAVGSIALCIIITGLSNHASNFEVIFGTRPLIHKIRVSYHWFVFVGTLGVAAGANAKFGAMKEWILQEGHGEEISRSALYIITNELRDIGLQGWGFFTITYGFLGKILSVVLTYAILIMQLHYGDRTNNFG